MKVKRCTGFDVNGNPLWNDFIVLEDNSVTDAMIGNRTINPDTTSGYSNTGTITQILSLIVKAFKALKGTPNWYDAPSATMNGLKSSLDTHTGTAASTTVSGHVQLNNTVTSTSATLAATANSVNIVYSGLQNHALTDASTSGKGHVMLYNNIDSPNVWYAATANAVKMAYDRAEQAFQSASSGKSAIVASAGSPFLTTDTFTTIAGRIDTVKATMATNLTAKGVTAAATETLSALAAKIANIIRGQGTATAADVLASKTFTPDSGVVTTGTMTNVGKQTGTIINQGGSVTITKGYHDGTGSITANLTNLSAPIIASGSVVGGITGTYAQIKQVITGKCTIGTTGYGNTFTIQTVSNPNYCAIKLIRDFDISAGNYIQQCLPIPSISSDGTSITLTPQWNDRGTYDWNYEITEYYGVKKVIQKNLSAIVLTSKMTMVSLPEAVTNTRKCITYAYIKCHESSWDIPYNPDYHSFTTYLLDETTFIMESHLTSTHEQRFDALIGVIELM